MNQATEQQLPLTIDEAVARKRALIEQDKEQGSKGIVRQPGGGIVDIYCGPVPADLRTKLAGVLGKQQKAA